MIEEGDDLDINLGPISRSEVMEAINKTKNGKGPGPDNISPKFMKADTIFTENIMISLPQDAWENEEMPMKWKTGYIVKLLMKRDLSDRQNWRRMQLLSIPSKALTRLILERIRKAVDNKGTGRIPGRQTFHGSDSDSPHHYRTVARMAVTTVCQFC